MWQETELVDSLLFSVVSEVSELAVEERLHVAVESGRTGTINQRWLAKLLQACGCREEARKIYAVLGHSRLLGDMALADGDLQRALGYFSKPSDDPSGILRGGPDYDRLLAIRFLRREWMEFMSIFREAKIEPLTANKIILNHTACSGAPWARRLAIAATRAYSRRPPSLDEEACRAFGLQPSQWTQMLDWAGRLSDAQLAREDDKLVPRELARPVLSLQAASEIGDTDRAAQVIGWILSAPSLIANARENMQRWLDNGDRDALALAVAWTTGGFIHRLTELAFFELTDRRKMLRGSPERVCEAYRAHPQLFRIGLGHYLFLKISTGVPLTGEDLLAGVFQTLGWPERRYERRSQAEITITRLQSCESWAEVRLDEWSRGPGANVLAEVDSEIQHQGLSPESDVRRRKSWLQAMEVAVAYLSQLWRTEIGKSPWISEMQALALLRNCFRGAEIVHHASPLWLAPQHLDVYFPELRLGVEYMGIQHYEPVEVFGGEEAFRRTVERDERKRTLCQAAGVSLEYIRYDEKIATRVQEIARRYPFD